MGAMPTLYLRDVPVSLYERLRDRAHRNLRSMNAEAIAALEEALEDDYDPEELMAAFRRAQFTVPPGSPSEQEMIRKGRDDEHDADRPRR
jgi:plasmid stability protein